MKEMMKTYGINYDETFVLIAKMNMSSMVTQKKSAWRFSYDYILIMKEQGMHTQKDIDMIWNICLSHDIHRIQERQGDYTLFIKYSLDGELTILLIYVNDMIVTGDDEIEMLIGEHSTTFDNDE
ncbi:hypothetical protein CR513_60309, partial [Mucuna pruriens]